MNSEDGFVMSVKGKNHRLFSAPLIQIKPDALERIIRDSFRAGQRSQKTMQTAAQDFIGSILGK